MKSFYVLIFMIFAGSLTAQNIMKGKVLDSENNEPLIGATVMVNGTTTGTITDVDGNYEISVPNEPGQLVVTYVGFEPMYIAIGGDAGFSADKIMMASTSIGLSEAVITGVMDIVRDRRTPVAVSTITQQEIQAKQGNVEFPELMKSTPSIYVANQAGGYGDSEVFTRGFDQTNTAFLLNGQPINGMEDGKMYWSNWSGMTDVASAVQIQRGLGSSKLAISSVGGTTNIIMKATEREQGGSVGFLYGNDNYMKATASYSTGMINDKFGISMLLTHWQGDGWAEGTNGQGQNYFISAGFKPAENHTLNFLITGAPQWHDQNFSKRISQYYNDGDEFNIKFNNNFGMLDGEYYSLRRNYYHKPVSNLNWEWDINDKSSLSTVVYASWGRGGGSGDIGNRDNRFYTSDGYIDWDAVHAANVAEAGDKEWVVRNSVNNHSWYGMVSTFETILNENFTLAVGADLRTYNGSHFRELRDLMGAPAYTQRANARFGEREVTNVFEANPWKSISNYATELEDRIAYNNDETISYAGAFGQLEYNNEKFTAFIQGAVSNQNHVRIELFNEPESNEESEKVNNLGYNGKVGASYSFDDNNTIFANTGYYERQPFHDDIYLNFSNFVNPVTVSEKIFGLEAGYKYSNPKFAANLNLYRTSWKDRSTTRVLNEGDMLPSGDTLSTSEGYRNSLQNQLHSGIEIDFVYKITPNFRLKGYTSIGDWAYEGTLSSEYYDEDRNLLEEDPGSDVDGVKVGGAAQTTFGVGIDWRPVTNLSVDVDYNFYSGQYAQASAVGMDTELELPSFGILDVGAAYNFILSNDQVLTLRANVFNALGKEYISRMTSAVEADADDANNWEGVNKSNFVTFGKTTTWNVSAKYSF